ncbi:MAG: rod shape-determining protein MreC [bacterium]
MQHRNMRWAALLALIAAGGITIFQIFGWWRPVGIVLEAAVSPIGRGLSGMSRSIGESLRTVTSLGGLADDNRRLQQEVADKSVQISQLKETERENDLLRQQLNFDKTQGLPLVGAHVVAYSPDNVRHTLVIDRGSREGIATGQAVVSSGILVGKVDRVSDNTATVFLVSDPEFRIQAIGQSERARGIIRGQLGAGLRFEQIAQNETVAQGENVLTAGSDKAPRGLLIGKVESVLKSDNEVFQSANVRSLLDFNRLEIVFVVKT